MSITRRWSHIPGGILGLIACVGCQPSQIKLRLRSEAAANDGRPLVILVRSVDGAARFRSERYPDIERLVTAPDPSVLLLVTLQAGETKPRCIAIPYPTSGGFGIYALYSSPSADWRILFEPTLPDRVDVTLGRDGFDHRQTREHFPLRPPAVLSASMPRTDAVRGAATGAVGKQAGEVAKKHVPEPVQQAVPPTAASSDRSPLGGSR